MIIAIVISSIVLLLFFLMCEWIFLDISESLNEYTALKGKPEKRVKDILDELKK